MSDVPYTRNGTIISIKFVICDAKNVICPQSYKPIHIQNCHMRHKNVICSSMSHVQKMLYIKGNLSYPHKTKSSNINIQISTNSVHFLLNFINQVYSGK